MTISRRRKKLPSNVPSTKFYQPYLGENSDNGNKNLNVF